MKRIDPNIILLSWAILTLVCILSILSILSLGAKGPPQQAIKYVSKVVEPQIYIDYALLEGRYKMLESQNHALYQEYRALEQKLIKLNGVPLTDEEFELVCRIVAAEARGEKYMGQRAVAQTIKNRYQNGNYGSTISEVVLAPGQFAEPWNGNLDKYPTIATAVKTVFNGHDVFDGELIYFFNPATANENAVSVLRGCSILHGTIGNHEFRGFE